MQQAAGYAQALYSLAKEECQAQEILQQLEVLDEAFAGEPDFLRLMAAPNLSKAERCRILDESFRDKVHPYVLNFLKLLTEKGYIRHFSDFVREYEQQYNDDNGIICVQVVTAVAITSQQEEKLCSKLQTVTGKTVKLTNRVDPACMGGVRLDYDGKRIDGTVKSRLEDLRAQLNNTVL